MCEQQYFIEYVLGWRGPSGQKADKGTIVHKILEILAVIKKAQQDNHKTITDDIVGLISTESYDLTDIIQQVYTHYSTHAPHHKWTPKDHKDCSNWTHKALEFNSGMFDPRNRNILCPEQKFDLEITKPWAKYCYDTPQGKIEGYLAIKGTIDLITQVNDKTIEIIDWKTGKRRDWATGQEKTLEKLQQDPQLKMYHYAISRIYPHIEHIIFSIYFINDGGPFSICFDKSDLASTEDMLRRKFALIQNSNKPRLKKSWMCTKLCNFGKTTFDKTSLLPILEYREGQVCKQGEFMTKCEQIKHEIDTKGMEQTLVECTNPTHSIGNYKAPGSI